MNDCNFMGNLVADPELRYINGKEDGKKIAVLNFRIGVNNTRTKASTFPNLEAWGSGAELIAKYFRKGDLIRVYTELVTDRWPDPEDDSKMNYRDKFRVSRFEFPETNKKPVRAFIERLVALTDMTADELNDLFKSANSNGEAEAEPEPEPSPASNKRDKRDKDNTSKSAPARTRKDAGKRRQADPEPPKDPDPEEEGDDIPF